MKQEIHPKYSSTVTVACACGNTFVTGSTTNSIRVEICGACHPFYTGQERLVDTARRVEKFQEKMAKMAATSSVRKGKKAKVAKRTAEKAEKNAEADKTVTETAPAAQ